jgi:uncharacterized protein YjiS (DUF1127 family)
MTSTTVQTKVGTIGILASKSRAIARQLIENWTARAVIERLSRLDDKLLQDAGLDRSDIAWARQLPLTVNSETALFERAGRL